MWNSCKGSLVERSLKSRLGISHCEIMLWRVFTHLKSAIREDRPMTGRKTYNKVSHVNVFDCTDLCCNQSIITHITSLNESNTYPPKDPKRPFLSISRNLQSAHRKPKVGNLCKSDLRVLGIEERRANSIILYKFCPPYLSSA